MQQFIHISVIPGHSIHHLLCLQFNRLRRMSVQLVNPICLHIPGSQIEDTSQTQVKGHQAYVTAFGLLSYKSNFHKSRNQTLCHQI